MTHNLLLLMAVLMSSMSFNINASPVEEPTPKFNSEEISRGQAVYKKSNCAFCHGWAGDGQGHPRSPGAAANIRISVLDKDSMTVIIRCGVIGGAMPYHDRMAYRDDRCLPDPTSLKPESRPQKGKNINEKKLDALVSYLISSIQGRGEVTLEQCEVFYKPGSRNCLHLKTTD